MPSVSSRTADRRRGIPFSSRGPGGPVPPLPRYSVVSRIFSNLAEHVNPIERGISPAEPTGWLHSIWHREEMPHDAGYEALVDLASLAPALRLGLHPTRTSPLLRL